MYPDPSMRIAPAASLRVGAPARLKLTSKQPSGVKRSNVAPFSAPSISSKWKHLMYGRKAGDGAKCLWRLIRPAAWNVKVEP